MNENHSFGCIEDQIAMGLHDLSKTQVHQPKEIIKEELNRECRRCVYTDCPCIPSDYEKDRNGICNHFKDVFDENAELKEKLGDVQMQKAGEKSNLVSHLVDANTKYKDQLTKAKELLTRFIRKGNGAVAPSWEELIAETEQFLKNDNCSNVLCKDCTKEDCEIRKLGLV